MELFNKPVKVTQVFMTLVTLHSFIVGLLLLIIPYEYLSIFGFREIDHNFFQAQGAVFHFVMCIAYFMVILNPHKNQNLMLFSFYAKMTATVFLLIYFFFVTEVITVLLSGIGDFLMGLIILFLYRFLQKPIHE